MKQTKVLTCTVCGKEEHGFDRVFEISEEETNTIKNRTSSDDEFLQELDKYVKEKAAERTIFDEVVGIYNDDLVGGLVCSEECKEVFNKDKEKFLPNMVPVIITEKEKDNDTFYSFS